MAKPIKVTGVLSVTSKGYGFVAVDNDEDDIFVPAEKLNGAIHSDMVEIEVYKNRGSVIRIVERKIQNLVGTIMKGKHGAFVIPDDERLGEGFNVVGQVTTDMIEKKVVARFVGDHTVRITEVLGEGVGVDITSIIRSYNLYEEFKNDVEAEAKRAAVNPSDKEIARRLDLRDKFIITIDPADAKDLDDAISLEKLACGCWELGVHIADVSHYVKQDSALDKEAYARATSVYFPDRVIPMLPKSLSNDICSLNPHVDRLTLSCIIMIDPTGVVTKAKVHETIININHRFSYNEIQDILDDKVKNKKLTPWLDEAVKLARTLEGIRQRRGEVVFDVPEPKIILDEETGKIKDVIAYPHLMSHRIIESFMILANEAVAKKFFEFDLPFIYRTHEKPDPMKVGQLIDTLVPFKVQHRLSPMGSTGFDYQHMLDNLSPELKPIIGSMALRSMQKAKYQERNIGHFGLGASHYSHFTSPIRRYPDLAIHRIIKMMINRELSEPKLEFLRDFVKAAAFQSTRMEIAATEAEREVENLKRAEFMRDKIGEKFSGTISGIKEFGVFVYLPNTVEGLIRLENMPDDTYRFDAKQNILVGKRRTYKMGDKLDVIVSAVHMPRRQVEFSAEVQ
ncbi:MAG: ribonuclease R [Firmicutes bacterium]|nr:ribonuclease R [Bacillota bacterium]